MSPRARYVSYGVLMMVTAISLAYVIERYRTIVQLLMLRRRYSAVDEPDYADAHAHAQDG